jgi:hypothetical protein
MFQTDFKKFHNEVIHTNYLVIISSSCLGKLQTPRD